jgi:hypothetical protein
MTNNQKVKQSIMLAMEEMFELDKITPEELNAYCQLMNITKEEYATIMTECLYEIGKKIVEKIKDVE